MITYSILTDMLCLLQDALLTEGVARYKEQGWARVAEFMGDGLSELQCQHRWVIHVEPRWQMSSRSIQQRPSGVSAQSPIVRGLVTTR